MTKLESVSENTKVRSRNELNETMKTMNISSRRVLLLALAQLDSKKLINEGQVFRIHAHEYAKLSKVDINKAYQQLQEATEKLQTQTLRIQREQLLNPFLRKGEKLNFKKPKDEGYAKLNLTEYCFYAKDSGYVDISFSRIAEPYICMLEKNFTTQVLLSAARLSDTNASNLYNLISENKSKGKSEYFEICIEELKDKLNLYNEDKKGVRDYYYPDFKVFNRDVIKKSIKTIEEVTELKVKVEISQKTGRKASKLKISYKTDEQHKFEF